MLCVIGKYCGVLQRDVLQILVLQRVECLQSYTNCEDTFQIWLQIITKNYYSIQVTVNSMKSGEDRACRGFHHRIVDFA